MLRRWSRALSSAMPISSTAPSRVARADDVGDMAEHLADDVDRLQRGAVAA